MSGYELSEAVMERVRVYAGLGAMSFWLREYDAWRGVSRDNPGGRAYAFISRAKGVLAHDRILTGRIKAKGAQ